MSDPRYVVAAVHPHPEWPELTQLYRVLDLPDAEHVHITRHPDGTITATPMRPGKPGHCHYHDPHNQGRICMGPSWDCERVPTWVDNPAGGDQ